MCLVISTMSKTQSADKGGVSPEQTSEAHAYCSNVEYPEDKQIMQ